MLYIWKSVPLMARTRAPLGMEIAAPQAESGLN